MDLAPGYSVGGGMFSNAANMTVRNCSFTRCQANEGAGYLWLDGSLTLERCEFTECAGGGASAIGIATSSMSATVRDCVFRNNTGNTALTVLTMPTATVEGCLFVGNSSVINAAGLTIGQGGTAVIRDNVFWMNDGSQFRGVLSWRSIGSIERNTFHGNVAPASGGVLVDFSNLSTGTALTAAGNVFSANSGGPAYRAEFNTPMGGCNLFWSNPGGDYAALYVPSATDVFADPRFCDPSAGDFTVREGSPCIEGNTPGCGQIGAMGHGCGVISVDPLSWGQVKALYRGQPGR